LRKDANGKVSLAISDNGPWTSVKVGDVYEGYTVQTISPDGWVALEKDYDNDGQIVYVTAGSQSPLRIKKLLGKVGLQVAREIPGKSDEYWQKLLDSEKDILAEEYLADPREPSYERTKGWLAPFEFPYGYVGMLIGNPKSIVKGYPHEVHIAWDGSFGLDRGFFTGIEPFQPRQYSPNLPFTLNGREIAKDESLTNVFRSQLDLYLPITQFVYQRKGENLGWEQITMMSQYGTKPVLLVRYRLYNAASKQQEITLSVNPPYQGKFAVEKDKVNITYPWKNAKVVYVDGKEKLDLTDCVCNSVLYASKTFVNEANKPVWKITLPEGASEDIYFYLPGHSDDGALVIRPDQIKTAFFTALKREKENWETALSKCVQFKIPEPQINDIYKAVLAKLWLTNDGDELRGGAVHYEGFWPFTAIESCKFMLDLGYFDEAKFYLDHFLKIRVEPTGPLRFDYRAHRHQIFDIGYLLNCLARYYWYTGDGMFFEKYQKPVDLMIGMIERNRQVSRDKFGKDDPRYGMLTASMNNDIHKEDYYYTNDTPVAMGIAGYAQALEHYGVAQKENRLIEKAGNLAKYAKDYYALLRKSFETSGAADRIDGKITYIHHHPLPPETVKPALDTPYRQPKSRLRAQTRFHEFPRLAEAGLLNEEELRAFFEYQSNHERTILGMKRYMPGILDDFRTYHAGVQKLRLGMVREYLMHYYAFLNYVIVPDMWIGLEQSIVIPKKALPGRKIGGKFYNAEDFIAGTGIQGWDGIHPLRPVPSETKWIFAFDEPDGSAVWIGRAIPNHWLSSGQKVGALGLTTRYGMLDLSMHYQSNKRLLDVVITPKEERLIPELRIGVRDPEGRTASTVQFVGSPKIKHRLDKEQDLVYVYDVKEQIHLRVKFDK
jgi:hypothetical protein